MRAAAARQTEDRDPAPRAPLAAVPDRAEREAAAIAARQAFCARLQNARMRAGVDLEALARATKVSTQHFIALERGDLSRWPTGIYRRSFFRAYVVAIGWPVDETVDEFGTLFPDAVEPAARQQAQGAPVALRLTLAGSSRPQYSATRPLSALADVAVVLFASAIAGWLLGLSYVGAVALVALTYYTLSIAVLGTSFTSWLLSGRTTRTRKFRLLSRDAVGTEPPATGSN